MKKIIMIIGIALICFVLGFLGYKFIFSSHGRNAATGATAKSEKTLKGTVSYSPSDSIITNIKNSNKYLKIAVTFEIRDAKSRAYYDENTYKIKDIIINVLRNKTEEELIAPNSLQSIKADMRQALAKKLDTNNLIDIYIDDFVIQ